MVHRKRFSHVQGRYYGRDTCPYKAPEFSIRPGNAAHHTPSLKAFFKRQVQKYVCWTSAPTQAAVTYGRYRPIKRHVLTLKALSSILRVLISSPNPSLSLGMSLAFFLVPPGLLLADLLLISLLASELSADEPLMRAPILGMELAGSGPLEPFITLAGVDPFSRARDPSELSCL